MLFGQSGLDKIVLESFNLPFLEQLTFNEINKIREKKSKEYLYPDSVLQQAAINHANYLSINKKLTHYQKENKALKDPQLRVEFFGALDIQTGENILMFPFGVSVKQGNGKLITPVTYQNYAEALVNVWMESKPHKANILTNDFNFSAIAISLSKNGDTIYAVQVFGDPLGEYEYFFPSESFPYAVKPVEKKKSRIQNQ